MPNFDGQTVGRISIKVTPDLDGFRRELREELLAIEKTERGKVKVDVDADTAGVREQIEAAAMDTTAHVDVDVDNTSLDRFQRRLLGEMSSILTRMEPKIRLDVDGEHLRREMNKKFAKIGKTIRAKIPVEPEMAAAARAKAMAQVTGFKESLESKLNPVKFDVEPKLKTFESLLKQRLAEVAKNAELKFDLDPKLKTFESLLKQRVAEVAKNAELNDLFNQRAREIDKKTGEEDLKHAKQVAETRERHARMLQGIEDRHAATRHRNEMRMLKERTAAMSKMANDMELEVNSRLDKDDFAETLAEAKALAARANIKLDVDIKDKEAEAKLAETIAKLKVEAAAARIKIKVDIDHDTVKRSFGMVAREGIQALGKGLKNNISLLSDDTVLIAAAVLALGAPLLGTITGAVAGLPALLAGIAAPIGAIVVGFSGIAKAAQPVVDAFNRMSEVISGKFEKALTPVFENLATLEPLLTSGFSRVADGLSGIFTQLGNTLTSQGNTDAFTRIFENITRGLDAMSPGISSFFNTLIRMTDKGAEHLKGLGDWFSGLMDRIGNAVDSAISNGSFDKAISGLKPVLEGLANGIGNIFSTAFDWFSNPANSERTGKFLEQLGSLVKGALKVSEVVFPVLEKLGEYIGKLVDQFSTSGTIDLSGLFNQILNDIASSAQWGTIGGQIGRGIAKGIFGVLRESMASGLATLMPWNQVAISAQDAFQHLAGVVRGAMARVFQEVVIAGTQVIAEVATWPGKITGALGNLGSLLVEAGHALMNGLLKGIKDGLFEVLKFAGTIAAKIAAVKGPLPVDRTILVENGRALMEGLGTGIEQGFQGVLDQAKNLAARIQEAIDSGSIKTDLGVFSQQYQRQMDAIQLERQQLQMQLAGTEDKGEKKALREQLSQLSTVQQTLRAQSQQLRLTDRYGGALGQTNNLMGEMLTKVTQMGQQFAQANSQQLMSDLGISGQGAIPQLANLGIGYMSQMLGSLFSQGMNGGVTIQVNSVDEALAARQNIVNKQALRYGRR